MVFAVASCGVAHAKTAKISPEDWAAVGRLAPGTEINVQAGDMTGPDLCRVSTVDDSGLTCLDENPARDTRLIFPRDEVQDVWVFEVAPERHIVRWCFIAAGVGLATALIVTNGIAGFIVAISIASVIEAVHDDPFRPVPPPRPPQMR